MANSKVALLRYVRIARGWRRFRVHVIRRGRGWDERISPPEGAEILERGEFQLRWYRGADAVYKGVGHDLQEPFWYDQPYAEAISAPPPVVVVQERDDRQSQIPPPAKPLVIEVPGAASSTTAKKLPPTIFILTDGERLESRRFLLTASNLSVSVDRRERTIPIDMLDINATIAANRERGVDLRVPADRTEVFLSF